jgi:mono/diheme cytochrome c family protein
MIRRPNTPSSAVNPLGLLLCCAMIGLPFRGVCEKLDEAFGEELYLILEDHCLDCHDEGESKGDLSLELLDLANLTPDHAHWEKVVKKLRHRQMPPMDKARPNEDEYETLAGFLESQMDREAARDLKPGRTDTFRRLTRTEYRNAVRDLLGLELDVSSLLPEDEISHGFDNITVGSLSPTLMEQYLAAAKKISRLAIGRPVPTPRLEVFRMPLDLTQEHHLDGLPLGTRGGGLVNHVFPVDGAYEVRLKLFRDRYEAIPGLKDVQKLDLLLDGETVERFTIDPPEERVGHGQVDQHLVARFHATAGNHRLGAAFVQKTSALKGADTQPWLASFNEERHKRSQPALYSIALTGPFESTGPGNSLARKQIFGDSALATRDEDQRARQILSRLMRLAYRRPITASDLEMPYRFYQDTREKEEFESGIEMGLRAILTSVDFLFRVEPDPSGLAKGEVYSVSDLQLASRLSFFLWSSIPDDALLRAAENQSLSKPEVLAAQVTRMLADPRSDSLITNFASQWLYLRNVSNLAPDPRLFMDFDDNLRQSMQRETEFFLTSILREDRSVLDILGADYTFLDERLAKHYEIPHVYGSRFRRISLMPDSQRGGLLSHASILTLSSYADRTSPVVRGAWILENILGTPPDPPPPGVEALKGNGSEEPQTMRERFAIHRSQKSCAACHDIIDPLGFALERFDAIGRRRTEDNGLPIDSYGELADGTPFDDADSLQQALLKRPELFVTTLTEKLLTYALGRGVEYYDAPAIRKIVRDGREDDYTFSSLIQGIAQSPPFTMKTAQ